MKTNQKTNSLLLFLFFLISSSVFYCYGQKNIFSDLKRDGVSVEKLKIKITPPKGQTKEIEVSKKTPIESGSIVEVSSKIDIYITSLNGNIGHITGPNAVEFTATETGEEYRVINGSGTSNVIVKVFKQLTGGVLTSGPTGEIHARSRLTEFLLAVDENYEKFELIEGKIDINRRQKFEINNENKIDSIKTRAIYVTESKQLNLKNSKYNFKSDSIKAIPLLEDHEIKKFFDYQFNQQKKNLTKAGSKSKQAFKYLDNGDLDNGLQLLEEAYNEGEIRCDLIIQSSLIITESYFINDNLKKSKAWLEVGLHFSDLFYKINKDKFEHYSKLGNDKIIKAFGYDFIVSNEYKTWVYTLKARINGCLENENENPSKFRREVNRIGKEISEY